eukprot:SAG11_NODE_689_length_7713_cov_3.470055_9_plen_130_part_00
MAADGLFIRDAYDDHFQEGVVTADPEMLLGIQRKRWTDADGVDIIDCVQPDYIETLYKTYEDDPDMPQHRLTESATPHLHLDLGGDSIPNNSCHPRSKRYPRYLTKATGASSGLFCGRPPKCTQHPPLS